MTDGLLHDVTFFCSLFDFIFCFVACCIITVFTIAMSSLPSSSGSANGHANHVNGATSHTSSEYSLEPNDISPGEAQASEYLNNGCPRHPYQNHHNEEIVRHLYHSGFQTGNYADTILHVHQNTYRLHAIILSRSPLLAHLMSTSPPSQAIASGQHIIYVHLDQEPEVTEEGFAIALGYLYSVVSLNLIRPDNARAVLAAGCLLGGMDDLCGYAYETCRQSISVGTISGWVEFIDSLPSPAEGAGSDLPKTIFGLYAQRLKDDVLSFLVDTLPESLEVHETQTETSGVQGRDVLLQIYSRVPFEMFKTAVESPSFRVDPTGSDQARFKFAKEAIELRKRGIARGSGAEETVVLAFGGGNGLGSSVHITRKIRKRPLWKVNV